MIFRPELVDKILAGSKTVTRRRLKHRDGRPIGATPFRYQVGMTYAIQPGRGKAHVGHILVRDVVVEPLKHMTVADCQAEGFKKASAFLDYWESLHGEADLDEPVAVIRFELAPRCDDCHFWRGDAVPRYVQAECPCCHLPFDQPVIKNAPKRCPRCRNFCPGLGAPLKAQKGYGPCTLAAFGYGESKA
jgi:hypothetical protein